MNIQQAIFSALSKTHINIDRSDFVYVDSTDGGNFTAFISADDYSEHGTRYTTVKDFLIEILAENFSSFWDESWNSKQ